MKNWQNLENRKMDNVQDAQIQKKATECLRHPVVQSDTAAKTREEGPTYLVGAVQNLFWTILKRVLWIKLDS